MGTSHIFLLLFKLFFWVGLIRMSFFFRWSPHEKAEGGRYSS
jgi:hypothetical protein